MNRIAGFLSLICFGLVVSVPHLAAADAPTTSPLKIMTETIDKIVVVCERHVGDAGKGERRAQLRELINPKFNFAEMSRRSLGASWMTISPEEQKEFVTVFSELLARTYLNKIETVKSGMVKVDTEDVEGTRAVVKTTVTSKGETFPIDYKMQYENNSWQVYDVVIENIGLVANYRNEFAGIIRKEKFSGLMERLQEQERLAAFFTISRSARKKIEKRRAWLLHFADPIPTISLVLIWLLFLSTSILTLTLGFKRFWRNVMLDLLAAFLPTVVLNPTRVQAAGVSYGFGIIRLSPA